MPSPFPADRSDRRTLAAAVLAFVFLSTLVLFAAGIVRCSEAESPRRSSKPAYSHASDGRQELSWALLAETANVQMGTGGVWEDFEGLRDRYDRDLLWFSLRGKRHVVLDEKVLEEVRRIVAPMNELGEKQGRLGERQGRLGERQGALGEKQARIGIRQAALSSRLASLALEGDDTPEEDAIENALQQLAAEMEALARQQEPLAREQEDLGRRQSEMGRQMERLTARANDRMRRLVDLAIEDGTAKPLRD